MSAQKAEFSIFYDAAESDLSNHAIDAAVLGKSLTSWSELIARADEALNGQASSRLIVTAPPREGSLGIDLQVLSATADVVTLLRDLGLLWVGGRFVGYTALSLARELGKKRILRSETNEQGVTTLTYVDGKTEETIECSDSVAKLVTDPDVRKAIVDTIQKPMEGLENRVFRVETPDGQEVLKLEDEQISEIEPLPARTMEDVTNAQRQMEVYFVRVNFDSPSSGWRVKHMDDEFAVKIDDVAFFNRVRNNQASFSKDSLFVVDMHIRTVENARGLKSTYKIGKVVRQRT